MISMCDVQCDISSLHVSLMRLCFVDHQDSGSDGGDQYQRGSTYTPGRDRHKDHPQVKTYTLSLNKVKRCAALHYVLQFFHRKCVSNFKTQRGMEQLHSTEEKHLN